MDPYTNRSYTYAQVKSTASDFGKGLKALWDWQKGDVLGLYTPNCIDTPAITWGCHWAGGIISPANPGYTADELAFQLKDSGAKALVTQKPFIATAKKAALKAGIPEDRIILMGDERDPEGRTKHFTSIRNISGATRYRRTKVNPAEDLAFLVYSSGTTGHPKGVMLTHRNIVANVIMLTAGEAGNLKWNGGPNNEGDKILAFLPFFHIYGKQRSIQLPAIRLTRRRRSHLPHPPKPEHRLDTCRDAQVRPRTVLQDHSGLQDYFRLSRPASRTPAQQASHSRQVRLELDTNDEFRRGTTHKGARRRCLQAAQDSRQARLRSFRNESHHTYSGEFLS